MSPLFGRGRAEAQAAIQSCDTTLEIMESSSADLAAARRLRERAAAHARAGEYKEAVGLAQKAEETARLLDRLHTAAAEGVSRLRVERGRMAKLGMDVLEVDGLLEAAKAWMGRTVERGGDPGFPAYAKAGELALKGLKAAHERVPKFKEASAAVAEADRVLRESEAGNRFVPPDLFRFFVLKPALDVLQEARVKMKASNFGEAANLARWTIAMATEIRERYGRVTDAYQRVEQGVAALRSEGGTTTEVENLLAVCRVAIEHGKFDEATEVAGRAGSRLDELRDTYRALVLRVRTVEEAIAEVAQWGFDVRGPRTILKEAVAHLDAGRYEEASVKLDEARASAQGLRDTHRTTAARITELRKALAPMRAADPSGAEEAEGLLGKAESLLEEGRYRECEENLQIASLLVVNVPSTAAPRRGGFEDFLEAAHQALAPCPTCGGPVAEDGTCPVCSSPAAVENAPPAPEAIQQAVVRAREVIEEIGRSEDRLVREAEAQVAGCAMCGRPLDGDDVLCARCQALVRGRA